MGVDGRTIEREPVESDAIYSIGYDARAQTLEIEFSNESIYRYSDVPEDVYTRFMASDSKGKFFHGFILDKYRFSRVR